MVGRAAFGVRDEREQFRIKASCCHTFLVHIQAPVCMAACAWCNCTCWPPTINMAETHMQGGSIFRGSFDFASPAFDWGADYQRPEIPMKDLVIYELPGEPAVGFACDSQCNKLCQKCSCAWPVHLIV